MKRVGWIHQFDQLAAVGDVVSYIASLGLDRVAVKALDGADWMATYDKSPLAIAGAGRVAELEKQLAAVGVGLDCWVNVTQASLAGEATEYAQLVGAFGGRLVCDAEPYLDFWGDESDVTPLASVLDNLDRARLGVTFDPRRSVWVGLDNVAARASVAMPQVYDVGWLGLAEAFAGRWPELAFEPLVSTSSPVGDWAQVAGSPKFRAGSLGVWLLPIADEGQRRFLRLVSSSVPPADPRADPDFRSYAPRTGTWREAATNLKGIADDALATGRGLVADAAAYATAASDVWHGR